MFERPKKNDLDTALSMLMHESRHKLMEEVSRIKGEAIKAGALHSNRVVVTAVAAADTVHKAAIEEAHNILFDFIERMERAPIEIVDWARPHLENLNNSVLGVVPPNGFPQDHQRLTHQYRAVFKQRLDIMLRNVEIGHQKGAGFARAEKVESKEEWISAAAALDLLKPTMGFFMATKAICSRAHDGVVRARAEHYVWGTQSADRYNVPKEFWWAGGGAALDQNWKTGDFETWIDQRIHLKAYGVSFLRADIQKLVPERETMAVKKRPGNVRDLSELAGSILHDVREDFLAKGLSSRELAEHYVGINLADLQQKHCAEGGQSKVDFDLALKELEAALFVDTGPMVPFDNEPGSGVFILSLFSKREYVYLTEAGYRAASQIANQKPPSTPPRTHVHISGGTFHQSQIGVGDQVTQMQRVDIDMDVGNALTALTQAIASEHSIPTPEREALLEQIAYLSEQAAHPAKDRKPGMIKATLGAISQAASTVASIAHAWETAGPLLTKYFGF